MGWMCYRGISLSPTPSVSSGISARIEVNDWHLGGWGTMAESRCPESYLRIMKGVRDTFPQLEGVRFEF